MLRVAVCVSGGGTNLQAIIDAIASGKIENAQIVRVISNNKNAYALTRAQNAGIEGICVSPRDYGNRELFNEALLKCLKETDPDLIVLAGFMVAVPACVINAFRGKIINIHPALLPAFKGLDAQGQALKYGVKIAGCTVHFVDAGMDSGPIILQSAVPVYDEDTHDTLAARILVQEHTILPEAVKLWCEGRLEVRDRRVKIRKE